jgi:hypothetical protein
MGKWSKEEVEEYKIDVKNVLKELEGYLTVPEEAVKNVKVFDVEELLSFLENSVEKYNPWNCE